MRTTWTLHDEIAHLAAHNDDPDAGGITREVFTPTYRVATDEVAGLMAAAGLDVREDAFGNLFGRWEGSDPGLPAVLTGSHYDTTLNAGAYDGVLGVLGAIAAVRLLRDEAVVPRRSIEVVGFAGEEPRFGSGCIGSRAMMGHLTRADLDRMRDRAGVSLADALRGYGLDPDALAQARIDPARVHRFVELHIEQGGVLEADGLPLGVVTRIAAPHDVRVTLTGAATHAGATPMRLRRDALAGAAEAMVELERLTLAAPSGTAVGTVGGLGVAPGAINVVPGQVVMDVDVRDSDRDAREGVVAAFLAALDRIAARRGLELAVEPIMEDDPATCDPAVVGAAEDACEELGIPFREIVSGAYHDAMVLGAEIPMGMIFVPSKDGISHHPDEYTAPEEIELGVRVLARTLARLTA
jgi:hydantoinase/carbamoylase family amidase